MTDPLLKLDNQLCFALHSASHAFARAYKPRLEKLGLTYPQYLVMLVLWEGDGLTVNQLGDRLFLESSTLTPLLKRLEAAGHIARRRDTADERQVRVTLTTQGRELRKAAGEIPAQMLSASKLDIATLGRLREEIAALRAALDSTGK